MIIIVKGLQFEWIPQLPILSVIRVLEQVIEWRGKSKALRCDNGPEYISQTLVNWADSNLNSGLNRALVFFFIIHLTLFMR